MRKKDACIRHKGKMIKIEKVKIILKYGLELAKYLL